MARIPLGIETDAAGNYQTRLNKREKKVLETLRQRVNNRRSPAAGGIHALLHRDWRTDSCPPGLGLASRQLLAVDLSGSVLLVLVLSCFL